MARIAGVNIPTNKRVLVALTYITGIGPAKSVEILGKCTIDPTKRVNELGEDEPWLLSRPASPQGPAGSGSAHPHECAHPQGPCPRDRW